jgi:hypothetical protein
MSIDAMKQALEALERLGGLLTHKEVAVHAALRLAIEQAERQEPVVVSQECAERGCMAHDDRVDGPGVVIEPQEKQEPVAWEDVLGAIARGWAHPENARKPMDVQLAVAIAKEIQDMYTTPPAAQRKEWQGLTDDEIKEIIGSWGDTPIKGYTRKLFDAIEAKLKEKNNTPPAAQRQPLTEREVELIDGMIEVQLHHAEQCDRIANRVMAEKQKGWDMERVELLRKLKAAHGIGGEHE